MPVTEAVLSDLIEIKHLASLDFCSEYRQCPLHSRFYEACRIKAPQGTFMSIWTQQELNNVLAYSHPASLPLFHNLKDTFKACSDHLTLHWNLEDRLLNNLREVFEINARYNLIKLVKKCEFYSKQTEWCGRIITTKRYELNLLNTEVTIVINKPVTTAVLRHLIHCYRWIITNIPGMRRKMSPLSSILEMSYALTGKTRKTFLKHTALHKLSWDTIHDKESWAIQNGLRQLMRLAFP